MNGLQRFFRALAYLLIALFVLSGIGFGIHAFLGGNTGRGFLGLGAVAFLLVPLIMKWIGAAHPYKLYILLFAFLILAYSVGCVYQGFDQFPYFDKISHFLSGIVFTIIGFCLFYYLNRDERDYTRRLWLSCTYALFFSAFVAVVWEICEFSGYLLTGHDSQHHEDTGVFDTMEDLISCVAGSLLSVGAFVLYCKKKIPLITGPTVAEFFRVSRKRK